MGRRIADYRNKQGLTLEDLAVRTGLEEGFLAAVEEEEIIPSLGPAIKIARAFGVRLGTFMDDQISSDPLIIRLSERCRQLTTHRGAKSSAEAVFYSLGRGKSDRHMEPFFVELLPGADQKLSTHEGEEFIVVLSGRVELIYGRDTFVLEPGDSMYYNSVVPHFVGSADDGTAEIHAVLYIPE
jgi:transcriptional regulator with XRE-family HTH domain